MISFLSRFKRARTEQRRRSRLRTARTAVLGEGLEARNLLSRLQGITGVWSGIFTNATGVAGPVSGLGTNTVQFGTPALLGGSPSLLSFNGASIPTVAHVNH